MASTKKTTKTKSRKTKITQRGDDERANDLVATEEIVAPTASDGSMEGKLAVDVYQTTTHLIIIAPIAGVEISDLEVLVEDDILTIRGDRHHITRHINEDDYLSQECFWGTFSRSIILPPNLDSDSVGASFKRGVLKIEIPKKSHNSKSIHIKD